MKHVHSLLWASLFWLSLFSGFAQTTRHAEAQLQPGDGALALLRRYEVETPCGKTYFYQKNNLRKNQGLVLHKQYILPILVYQYNGRSIRSTTGIDDLDWALQVQAYNDRMTAAGLKPGDFRQDRELWVPYHYLHCKDQILAAPAGGTQAGSTAPMANGSTAPKTLRGNYAIFGKEHANVYVESNALAGRVYYIVGGHGGPDPGAVGTYYRQSLCEDEYAYDVALRLSHHLLAHGATVYIILRDPDDGIRSGEILPCDKDETCWLDQEIPINQSARLFQRSDAINELYQKNLQQGVRSQYAIEIHVDAATQSQRVDMFFYHQARNADSERMARIMRETIKAKYDEYRQGRGYEGTVSARDLHMLREVLPPTVYIELGNIRNREDQARLVIEGNRQLIANWLTEGILLAAREGN